MPFSTEDDNASEDQHSRTKLVLGEDGFGALQAATVCVFGVGGVGSYVVEALARAGIGTLHLVDNDTVSISNINRQIIATWETVGKDKVEVAAQRIRSINPSCKVVAHKCFYLPQTREQFDFRSFDYVVDAIDTVTAKLDLIVAANEAGTPIISSMGTGNKLDPCALQVADINDTSVCHLARIMRKELRKRGIPSLKCVYSQEPSQRVHTEDEEQARQQERAPIPGSVSFVPSAAGLIIAGEVVKDLVAGAKS